jgi:hypothetical protein
MVVDRHWNVVAANEGFRRLVALSEVEHDLLAPPVNALRVAFHPRGMAPSIVNLADWRAHFLERLEGQLAATADPAVAELIDEVRGYPVAEAPITTRGAAPPVSPVVFRTASHDELSFFGMFAAFNTAFEVVASELAVELLFPADDATAAAFEHGRDSEH